MVNEPLPHQLLVSDLRLALEKAPQDGVVALELRPDDVSRLKLDLAAEIGTGVFVNLRFDPPESHKNVFTFRTSLPQDGNRDDDAPHPSTR